MQHAQHVIMYTYMHTYMYKLCKDAYNHMYMEIHVYSTLAYVKVGRKERQPRQWWQTYKMRLNYIHVYMLSCLYIVYTCLYTCRYMYMYMYMYSTIIYVCDIHCTCM